MPSAFENLCGPGKPLKAEPPDAKEFSGLKRSGLGPEVWRVLSKCHDLRNLGEYEGDLNIDERIVADLITACRIVAAKVEALPPTAAK